MGGAVSSRGSSSAPGLREARARPGPWPLLASSLCVLLGCATGPGMAAAAVSPPLLSRAGSTALPTAPSAVEALPQSVLLRCQIDGGDWQPCRMVIDRIGEHWWLLLGPRRFEFRHDGHGNVTIREGRRLPRPVTPQWRSTGVLCWDGLCAEGSIPLD